jgi:hypothetical protein
MSQPTAISGSRAYFTTYPEEATLVAYMSANPNTYSVGTVITCEDTGVAYQVLFHPSDGTVSPIGTQI